MPSHRTPGGLLWGQMWPVTAPLLEGMDREREGGVESVLLPVRFLSCCGGDTVCLLMLEIMLIMSVSATPLPSHSLHTSPGSTSEDTKASQEWEQERLEVLPTHIQSKLLFFLLLLLVIRSSDSTSAHKEQRAARKRLVSDTRVSCPPR